MAKSREVRITGGADRLLAAAMTLVEQLEGPGDVEAELVVKPNAPTDPELVLNFNSTDCDEGDELLVEYEELSDA